MFFRDRGSGVPTTHNSLNPSVKTSNKTPNKTPINICNTFYGAQFTFLCIIFICWISRTRCTGTQDVNTHMSPCVARLFCIYVFLAQEWTLKHLIRVFFFYSIRGPPHSLSFHRSRALLSLLGAMRLPAPVHWANLALLFIQTLSPHLHLKKRHHPAFAFWSNYFGFSQFETSAFTSDAMC